MTNGSSSIQNEVKFVLRSAIYHRADDLPFWAAKYDGDLAKLINMLLDDPSPEMRAAAAAAAGTLELQDETIVEKCCKLALKADEPNQVRPGRRRDARCHSDRRAACPTAAGMPLVGQTGACA